LASYHLFRLQSAVLIHQNCQLLCSGSSFWAAKVLFSFSL